MNKKLTLTVDEDVVGFAKEYAFKNGTSISALVTDFFQEKMIPKGIDIELSPLTKKFYGIFKDIPAPSKKELRKMFHEKSAD